VSLKQGAGRLIRTVSDRGLLVICDSRLRTARSLSCMACKDTAPMTSEARSQIRKSALRWPTRVSHSP